MLRLGPGILELVEVDLVVVDLNLAADLEVFVQALEVVVLDLAVDLKVTALALEVVALALEVIVLAADLMVDVQMALAADLEVTFNKPPL